MYFSVNDLLFYICKFIYMEKKRKIFIFNFKIVVVLDI